MKKRKSPIVLVTLLAITASVAFGLNYAGSRTGGGEGHEEAPPAPPVADTKPIGTPRGQESKEGVSQGIKSAMGGAPEASSPPSGPPGRPGVKGGPMILNPAQAQTPSGKPEKPKPNSSSTSTQWYEKESALSTP